MSHRAKSELAWGWFFILPTIVGLVVLNIYPIFSTIFQSFHRTGDFGMNNVWIGLDNYKKALVDPKIQQSIWNTLKYMISEVPLSIAISLVLAVLLNKKIVGRSAYRMIFFLPMVAAPAAIAMVWKWLYNTDYGLINNVFNIRVSWYSDPNISLYSIAVIGIWSIIGYNLVLFLAGLQEVPRDYYEAATIDGASSTSQFFNITLPLISPTIYFVFVTRIIGAMQVFDSIFLVMDRTNPALNKVQSLVYLFYKYSFEEGNKGAGATIVVILLLITLIITVLQNIGQKRWVHYN
ncbi:MAG: sugar ABC transporter permease [Clostridia bacterium]|nr:sugar ABC transporter permease [Clostridia bacterium]NLF19997.1 sugar ABC transporter permease [Clostridiaceae bacterium]